MYYAMKRYIVSILHAMIKNCDLSPKIKHAIQKDMVITLRAMNLLSDVLQLHYTNAKLLCPNSNNQTFATITKEIKIIGHMLLLEFFVLKLVVCKSYSIQ